MHTVSVHEAKTHLSRLLKRVQAGEEIIITNRGEQVAKISACHSNAKSDPLIMTRQERRLSGFGILKGKHQTNNNYEYDLPESLWRDEDETNAHAP